MSHDVSIEQDLDTLCINTVRMLAADAVQQAESGHPGMPMGTAPMAYALWTRHLRFNPRNPGWPDRDRFVLSAGHGSMLLYALLHLTGYDLPLEEIVDFRQWGSHTPGHPEYGDTPGVETTTGPLGQGFGNAVGMALAEARLAAEFNRPGHVVVDHHIYVIASDGDMMEGVQSEAASLAGHLALGKLIVLYDDNRITIDGETRLAFSEAVPERYAAYGWHVQRVEDGNDLDAVDAAVVEARSEVRRPSLIAVRTHIGYGSPNKQDTASAHGEPLGEEELVATKRNLGWPEEPRFLIPERALERYREAVDRGARLEGSWRERFETYRGEHPELAAEFERRQAGELPDGWDEDLPTFSPGSGKVATRKASGAVLNALAGRLPELIGGSADLTPSNKTLIDGSGDFAADAYDHRNLRFGVREHAMGAMLNGISLHGGLIPYGGTFLIFSDYMRPSVRLACLMGVPAIYVWTHDSIGLGEDGPTHQPVEHLASLRAIPNMVLIRPADANEVREAWKVAVARRDGPVGLSLTRQGLPVLDRDGLGLAGAEGLHRGAYVLADPPGRVSSGPTEGSTGAAERAAATGGVGESGSPGGTAASGAPPSGTTPPLDIVLIASGSEVAPTLEAWRRLIDEGVAARLVSFPCWELFARQDRAYRDAVLPPDVSARLAVEAAASLGWERWVGRQGAVVGVDRFGASAPGAVNMEKYGFTADNIHDRARELLG